MANSIHSKGDCRLEEFNAGEAGIYPGMLLDINSSGDAILHATEGGLTPVIVAAEDALQGNTVSTVYTSGDVVQCYLPAKGSEIRVLVKAGESIGIGDVLISEGTGLWIEDSSVTSGTTANPLVKAVEAFDGTVSGATNTLVRAIVL